jgi:hypothetical protein
MVLHKWSHLTFDIWSRKFPEFVNWQKLFSQMSLLIDFYQCVIQFIDLRSRQLLPLMASYWEPFQWALMYLPLISITIYCSFIQVCYHPQVNQFSCVGETINSTTTWSEFTIHFIEKNICSCQISYSKLHYVSWPSASRPRSARDIEVRHNWLLHVAVFVLFIGTPLSQKPLMILNWTEHRRSLYVFGLHHQERVRG